jgi:redox-sensitive bicupin YhaK (pirin superfamily)
MFAWVHAKTFCLYYKVRKHVWNFCLVAQASLIDIKPGTTNLPFHEHEEFSFKLWF